MALAGQIGGPAIDRVLLVPPFTNETMLGGQDVVLPSWNLILPLVHKTFP